MYHNFNNHKDGKGKMSLSKSIIAAINACLLCIVASPAWATVIYTYTGNNFDTFSAPSSPDASMNVTVTLEFANLLSSDLNEQFILPDRFSISDGINTIDNTNSTGGSFRVGTDSLGNIDSWFIFATASPGADVDWYIETINSSVFTGLVWDFGRIRTTSGDDTANIMDSPGSWSVATVPEPSIIWLLGSGLALIGFARRKKA